MAASSSNLGKIGLIVALFGLAGFLTFRWMRDNSGPSEKAFYYDLSEKALFEAARGEIPPIRGINNAEEDGVRAVVVSTNGMPQRRSTWRIAYLEKYTPEMQAELRAAKAAGRAPEASRALAQAHRLVRRPGDADWVSMTSEEGEKIVGEWVHFGTGDVAPVVCSP